MTSNNYKQKAIEHVTSLAKGHLTGSDTPCMYKILTASSNKKNQSFCWHRTGCGDTCRLWSNEGIFLVLASVQQTAQKPTPWQDWGLSELHIPHALYTPPAFLLLLPVSGHLSRGFSVPPTKRAYSALHPQAFSECSPQDFQRSSVVGVGESHSWACSLQLHLHWPNCPSGQFPPRWWWKR